MCCKSPTTISSHKTIHMNKVTRVLGLFWYMLLLLKSCTALCKSYRISSNKLLAVYLFQGTVHILIECSDHTRARTKQGRGPNKGADQTRARTKQGRGPNKGADQTRARTKQGRGPNKGALYLIHCDFGVCAIDFHHIIVLPSCHTHREERAPSSPTVTVFCSSSIKL